MKRFLSDIAILVKVWAIFLNIPTDHNSVYAQESQNPTSLEEKRGLGTHSIGLPGEEYNVCVPRI